MLIVRCTAKLLGRLKARPGPAPAQSTTRLGDWYATILPLRPSHLVLLVSESTRLPVVLPAREISTLAQRIPDAIVHALRELGIDPGVIEEEREAMTEIAYARTASRSVLGTMNEFILHLGLMRDAQPAMTEHAMGLELGRVLVTVPSHGYKQPAEFTAQTLQAPARPPASACHARPEEATDEELR